MDSREHAATLALGIAAGCAITIAASRFLSLARVFSGASQAGSASKAGSALLATLADYEAAAASRLPRPAWDYFSSGACEQTTLQRNESVLRTRVHLRPRVLVDVSSTTCAHTLLGRPTSQPWGIAPTGFHALAHASAECATAAAAARAGVVYCVSGSSSRSLEEVAAAAAPWQGRRLYQLYALKCRQATAQLVARAQASGCEAIVLTVDRPVLGLRDANARNGFTLPGRAPGDASSNASAAASAPALSDSLTWADVHWLRAAAMPLPLILKGILTAQDAALAVQAGVAGVWVSNHGGRQLDGTLSSAEALLEVVQGVRSAEEGVRKAAASASASSGASTAAAPPPLPLAIWVDGGVRRGTDVLKYLALGADFVWVGRPVVWGLGVGGEEGVHSLLAVLGREVKNALQLMGVGSPGEVGPQCAYWDTGPVPAPALALAQFGQGSPGAPVESCVKH